MEHEHTRVADRTRTYDLYQAARERNELMRAAYVQPLSGILYESKLIGGSFRDVYVAVLHDFDPASGVRIFCGDRVPKGQRADYSTTALCIRGLLPMAQQAGHLFDLALCSLLSLYLARLRSDEMLHGFARRAYGDALSGLQEQLVATSPAGRGDGELASTPNGVLGSVAVALQLFEVRRSDERRVDVGLISRQLADHVDVSSTAFQAHMEAAMRLIQSCDPGLFSSPRYQQLFCGFRSVLVCPRYMIINHISSAYSVLVL